MIVSLLQLRNDLVLGSPICNDSHVDIIFGVCLGVGVICDMVVVGWRNEGVGAGWGGLSK